jgi:tellurite resistance-related uncharacterized protein
MQALKTLPGKHCDTQQAAPENARLIGRSRIYTVSDLSTRLRHWHAPRVNRWEKLCVTAGTLAIEHLDAGGVAPANLAAGHARWFAPGQRWRVADMRDDTRFELEVHADARGQAKAPQPLRSEVLDEAERVEIASAAKFNAFARSLSPGRPYLVTGHFDVRTWDTTRLAARTLFWHPLAAGTNHFTALLARSREPFDLAAYLGRDHAVIEATLGGALAACHARASPRDRGRTCVPGLARCRRRRSSRARFAQRAPLPARAPGAFRSAGCAAQVPAPARCA